MNIKRCAPKLISVMLGFAMLFSNVLLAYATETIIIESALEETEQIEADWEELLMLNDGAEIQADSESRYEEIEINYSQSSSYFVTIPKIITLGTDKRASYSVKVEGDIVANKQVCVVPVDEITDTEVFDFYMEDQITGSTKEAVSAEVSQAKFYWNHEEVKAGYEEHNNYIIADGLSAGKWKGTFHLEISMRTEPSHIHNYVGEITKEPTCTELGEKTYTCDCGESYTEAIDPTGHHYKNGECTDCGERDSNHEHSYREVTTKEPTCTEEGEKTYICDCGDSYTEKIPATGHDYVDGICAECGDEVDPYEVAPISAYSNWNYKLNDFENVIILNYYTGSETDVIVYANYVIDGKIYKTQIKSNELGALNTPYMFNGNAQSKCKSIKSIKFSRSIDTSNVTNMAFMFYYCTALTSLDLSGLDTSNVTNMAKMFYNCSSLTSLDLSSFDTSNVTNMNSMFGFCKALTSLDCLDLSSFDTSNVTDMGYMFNGCSSLTSLDLSSFDTSNVKDMGNMFSNCKALTSLDLSSFDTSTVTNMKSMFAYSSSLTSILVSNKWNTSRATTGSMFSSCGTNTVTYID